MRIADLKHRRVCLIVDLERKPVTRCEGVALLLVEKVWRRTYDYKTSGIDYTKGTKHLVEGSHYVRCTDEEFSEWMKKAPLVYD